MAISGRKLPLEVFHQLTLVEDQVNVVAEALHMYIEEFQFSADHGDQEAVERAREVQIAIDGLR